MSATFFQPRGPRNFGMIHEGSAGPAATLRDANSGATIFSKPNNCNCEGPGRGTAGDIYASNAGAEFYAMKGQTNLFNASGGNAGRNPSSVNFLIWWDGDFVRELLDSNHIDKYGTVTRVYLLPQARHRSTAPKRLQICPPIFSATGVKR